MPLRFLVTWVGLVACTTDGVPNRCVEPDLDLWCFHSESEEGPVVPDDGPGTCEPPSATGAVPCGSYEVVREEPGAFAGVDHYFHDGEHVAARYFTDDGGYCGTGPFWYGEVVTCETDGSARARLDP